MERPFNFNQRVPLPFAAAQHILRDEPAVMLGLARDKAMEIATDHNAYDHVMTEAPTPDAVHDVEMVIGEAEDVDDHALRVPVRWEAVDGARWFPYVDGHIEVADLDDSPPWIEVSLFGTYEPRYGIVGAVLDATATHQLVEDTLEHFLGSICEHLVAAAEAEGLAG